jgi:SAM-dependent methyltransferase
MGKKRVESSWDGSDRWYSGLVGEKGHYYHQSVILPSVLRLLDLKENHSLLDLGCGSGVLERHLPSRMEYVGVDCSKGLLDQAKKQTKRGQFILADATKTLSIEKKDFDRACFILSFQNMEHGKGALESAARHLKNDSRLLLVLNHPCFRIPRQSGWGIDEEMKIQYRRLNGYMSGMKIPIQTNPGKGVQSSTTYSFHQPLSIYLHWLREAGFSVIDMEEWCSDKKSEGGRAKMEDRARREFPLFLAILACPSKTKILP